jgi:hypothetical protein
MHFYMHSYLHKIFILVKKWVLHGHLPNSLASLLKANGYNYVPLYVSTWGLFSGSAPVWCVQVMMYEKELSYGVHVIRHTYHTTPQGTLDARVQDAAHQALQAFCQEL